MKRRRKIFDAHFHIGEWGSRHSFGEDGPKIRPLRSGNEHKNYLHCQEYLRKNGIDSGLVVPNYVMPLEYPFLAFNPLVIECVKKVDNIYGGLWVSPYPKNMELTRKALSQANHPKIRALKLSALTWPGFSLDPTSWNSKMRDNMDYIVDCAAQQDLVLQLHTGVGQSDPEKLSKLLNRYGTRCRFHCVHMGEYCGGVNKFVPLFLDWVETGYRVYCDIALVPDYGPEWILSELDRVEGGTDRILFATDAPWGGFLSHYWKIEGSGISLPLKRKVLYHNAATLYNVGS